MVNDILKQFKQDGTIDESALNSLEKFVDLFMAYNAHTNLSAVRTHEGIWLKHVVDSLMLLRFEELEGKLLDLGTGGGLPGIPLAIARPDVQVSLLDSVGKKVKACESFIEQLDLKNARAIRGRAEQLGQDEDHAGKYDIVVSRATAYLPTILAWSEQLVRPGGKIILYKTPSQEELADGVAAAKLLGIKKQADHTYILDAKERHLLVYVPIRTR